MQKCWECGKNATVFPDVLFAGDEYKKYAGERSAIQLMDRRKQRGYCEECFAKVSDQRKNDRDEYIRLRKLLMFERAVRILEKQDLDIYEYKEAIQAVSEYSKENPQKFDSSHEMIAAIVAIDNEEETKIGYKIGDYRIDLLLPKLKIALEVDGGMHEYNLYKDNKRDIEIRSALGQDWEVVRIKTEYIEENAELLLEAAKTIRAEKQKVRKQNYGVLPEWYSKRESAKKTKRQEYGDELLLD